MKLRIFIDFWNFQLSTSEFAGRESSMVGTIEKGVDSAIVTDLLSLAWDVAVLISSDRGFIPAVELLNRKGFRVLNAHFPPLGMELARVCWAGIDLRKAIQEIKR